MEYISMKQHEAEQLLNKFKHLEGTEFTDKDTSEIFAIRAVILAPSDAKLLRKLTDLIGMNYLGVKNNDEIRAFGDSYTKDEFTVVLFSQTISSKTPGLRFLPIQYLANQNGDLELGFGI